MLFIETGEETNVARDEAFVIVLSELEGRIPRLHTLNPPKPKLLGPAHLKLQSFDYSGYSIAEITVGTDAAFGGDKLAETVVHLDLSEGNFCVSVNDSAVVDSSQTLCLLNIRAQGACEALNLARLLELAGVALRRQIQNNTNSKT